MAAAAGKADDGRRDKIAAASPAAARSDKRRPPRPPRRCPPLRAWTATEGERSATEGRASTTEGPASASEGPASATEGETSPAEGELSTTDGETYAMEGEASVGKGKLPATEGETSPWKGKMLQTKHSFPKCRAVNIYNSKMAFTLTLIAAVGLGVLAVVLWRQSYRVYRMLRWDGRLSCLHLTFARGKIRIYRNVTNPEADGSKPGVAALAALWTLSYAVEHRFLPFRLDRSPMDRRYWAWAGFSYASGQHGKDHYRVASIPIWFIFIVGIIAGGAESLWRVVPH